MMPNIEDGPMIKLVKMILDGLDGKTFILFLESAEGIFMEQVIPKATVEFVYDEDGISISLKNTEFSENAIITINDDIAIALSDLDEEGKKHGSLNGFTITYESGSELQVEIYENEI